MNVHDLPLKKKYAHTRDDLISFCPAIHTYTIVRDGEWQTAPVSVTSFSKGYFSGFDGKVVVEKNYEKWKRFTDSKYYSTIHEVLDSGMNDAEAKQAILDRWAVAGETASREGTLMHHHAELLCNGVVIVDQSPEMSMLKEWMKHFQPHMQWKPMRTEWMLWWEVTCDDHASPILLAGTLDLLMWSKTTGVYGLFDFKRTNPKPKFKNADANILGPHTQPLYHPGYAKSPLQEVENSDYGKYAMQLNILSKILRERYGIDVETNMFLLQIHPELSQAHCVQVPDLTDATNSLFAVETERCRQATLAPAPPPTPAHDC